MKKFFLCSLLAFLASMTIAFAEDVLVPPIGFQQMLNDLGAVSTPSAANGKRYELKKPADLASFTLSLKPESAFAISNQNTNTLLVTVVNAVEFYDVQFFEDTGLIRFKKDTLKYVWTKIGDSEIDTKPGSFQSCSINVSFTINGKPVNKKMVEGLKKNGMTVSFEFNKSVLLQVGETETEFIFKRINNNEANVTLTVLNTDGTVYVKQSTANLITCEQKPDTYKWGEWSSWNSCSATCGGGTQQQTRKCLTENVGLPCPGNAYQDRACNTQQCPQWGQWSSWGTCSRACGGGTQRKTRECLTESMGISCPGNDYQDQSCNMQSCPVPEKPAVENCSILSRNAKWEDAFGKNAWKTDYAWILQNEHKTKSLSCTVIIKAVSLYGSPAKIGRTHDMKEFNISLAPGERQTLTGHFKVKLEVEGTYPGLRDSLVCNYK